MIVDNLENKICKLGVNHKQQILMVCLNKECETSRLCCLTCIDEFHRKHELISLHKFEQMLIELDERCKPHAKNDVISVIKQYQIAFNNQLNDSLQKAIKEYNTTKMQFHALFKEILQMLEFQKPEQSFKEQFYKQFDTKSVNYYLKKLSDIKNNSYETLQSTIATIKKSQNIFKTQIKDFQNGFSKLMDLFGKSIASMKKALTQSNFVPFSKRFSKINKAACLYVSQTQSTTKRFEGTGGYPINLLENPLTPQNSQASFKITEQPGNKGIWMGVAILDIVKINNFTSCYGIGKGTYAIDQVGASHTSSYTWNHHDTNFNSQPKVGWQFNLGDTVNIKVDFENSTVTFTRGYDQYTQPVRLDLGQLYAFAGPTNLNDCLQVV